MNAIVILGAAVWPGGEPSPTLLRRTLHAAGLYHQENAPVIACGGLGKNAPSEAEVMRDLLLKQGVPDTDIHLEVTSTSTKENIGFARDILQSLQIRDITIVTDRYHAPRARLTARRYGLMAATNCPSFRGANPRQQIKSFVRELPAYLYYALTLWP
jgi:uncharacterized SAM-binding protein YcdF (DUF218 family)